MLLKDDNMGFSFHITTIYEGTETHIHYQNHLESVFCMSGEGEIEVVGGETYPIKPGTLYILDKHDEHYLRAYKNKEMVMACVFNPPITGVEVHDENGVYPLVD
ncbi:cupin domain protein [Vibrio parahaemolyticus 10290]|nr:cupin domain protein [Vibrio parahaemolyticus 10290]